MAVGMSMPWAWAQVYPVKPIRIIVPFPPGGVTDVVARILAARLSDNLGQQVVVENRAGGASTIGMGAVAKSAADGYTLMLTSVSYTTNAAVQPKLPFDPVADITGIPMIGKAPMLLVVHPAVPAKSVKELVVLAKRGRGR